MRRSLTRSVMSWPSFSACSVVSPGAIAIRLPPSMRAVTSLDRRKQPDTQWATRRIVDRAPECGVVQIQGVDIDGEHRDAAVFPLRDGPVALQQLLQVWQRVQSCQAIVANRNAGRL